MRRDAVGDLLAREPHLARDVAFGVQATELLESQLSRHLLTAWQARTTSLLHLPDAQATVAQSANLGASTV